ncbi:hypothetical protein FSP39_006518 [Pinctada imbricata]|uniref:Tetratricopeptide repeat protein n=1 Tax=Pinctada imbricata TaxID=66713 RepID=A0AA88Y7W6_PINIB|nr:hypothetical protein FSP39_006518 [Pinctada imbricata]
MDIQHKFVGRESILEKIIEKWPDTQLFEIYGMRSVGKSRLANHLLKQLKELKLMTTNAEALICFNLERQNFRKLFKDVLYATDETYPMFIHLAMSATENILHYFIGSEGLCFFDQCLTLTQNFKRKLDEAYIHTAYGSAFTNVIGNLVKGEKHYREALGILLKTKTRDYHMAEAYQRIGWNLGIQGKYFDALGTYFKGDFKEAEKLHFENLRRRRLVYKTDNHPYIGSVMNNIGLMYQRMGHMEKAFEYFRNWLDIKVANHANEKAIILSQKNVANCLSRMGRYDEAMQEMNKAMQMLEKFPGRYVEVRAIAIDGKARIYMHKRDFHRAIHMLKQAIEIRKDLSPENINTVENIVLYAKACFHLAKYSEAKENIEKVLEMQPRLSKTHPREFCVIECVKLGVEFYSRSTDSESLERMFGLGIEELDRLYREFEKHEIEERCEYVRKEKPTLEEEYKKAKEMSAE